MNRLIFLVIVLMVFTAGCTSPAGDGSDTVDGFTGTESEPQITREESEASKGIMAGVREKTSEVQRNEEEDKLDIVLYYRDKDGYLIPVTRKFAKMQAIASAAINGLIDGPVIREELEYYGLYPVFPEGTEILGINIRDGTAVVDFSPAVLDYSSERDEMCIFSSVVYTLTQFSTVDDVVIWINGYADRELKFGNNIKGRMGRDNTMINGEYLRATGLGGKVDVFYLKKAENKLPWLVPVSIETEELSREQIPKEVVKRMAMRGKSSVVYSEIPEGTMLLDCWIDGDALTLDFNGSILDYEGTEREEGIIRQLLFSMGRIDGIEKVRFLVEGGQRALPGGTESYRWMTIPRKTNDCIDR